jgi:hypothetical protein
MSAGNATLIFIITAIFKTNFFNDEIQNPTCNPRVYTNRSGDLRGSVIFIIFIRLHAFFMMCNFCSCAIFVSYSQVKI